MLKSSCTSFRNAASRNSHACGTGGARGGGGGAFDAAPLSCAPERMTHMTHEQPAPSVSCAALKVDSIGWHRAGLPPQLGQPSDGKKLTLQCARAQHQPKDTKSTPRCGVDFQAMSTASPLFHTQQTWMFQRLRDLKVAANIQVFAHCFTPENTCRMHLRGLKCLFAFGV